MSDNDQSPQSWAKTCAKCGEAPPGKGGILCPRCLDEIANAPLYPQYGTEVTR